MTRNERNAVNLTFEWGPAGVESLAPDADVLVVVDVLSFSTTVSVAVERDATVLPYRFEYDTARAYADARGAILAVHRADVTAEQPYSLSPASLASAPRGARIVLPSPNGSACCVRAAELGVAHVLVGSLRNATATATAARRLGTRIAVIAAGERWPDGSLRPAVEDAVGAGAILARLEPATVSPEAAIAIASYEAAKDRMRDIIARSISGRELIDQGYDADVDAALDVDASSLAAVLRDGAIVAATAAAERTV